MSSLPLNQEETNPDRATDDISVGKKHSEIIISKAELYDAFRHLLVNEKDPDAPYQSVYWSPSGGTTGASLHVPVDAAENTLQRASLIPLLLAGKVWDETTIDANLFDTGGHGFLYRAREIFHDLVTQCQGTSLPLGWSCPDAVVVQRCRDFRTNAISASPSRIAQLAGYIVAQLRRLEQQERVLSMIEAKDSKIQQQQQKQKLEQIRKERQQLDHVRDRITRGVFACEPLHDMRKQLIRQAFPNIIFASIIGSSELGCWGVSLPSVMEHFAFLYDRRVVSIRTVQQGLVDDNNGKEEKEFPVGRLVMTNHIRQRFPVNHYDTGDLGQVVPASTICTDTDILEAVEQAARNGTRMRDWQLKQRKSSVLELREERFPLIAGVVLTSRAAASAAEQFNIQAHTLSATELVNKASDFVRDEVASKAENGEQLGPFVNGQVLVWFQLEEQNVDIENQSQQQHLRERVNVRVNFANNTPAERDPDIIRLATESMRSWVLTVLSGQGAIADAITITVTSQLEATKTASNQNKIPLLKDLRYNDYAQNKADIIKTTKLFNKNRIINGNEKKTIPEQPMMAAGSVSRTDVADPDADFHALSATSDGLHAESKWIGAFQISPTPLWDLPYSRAITTHNGLVKELQRVFNPRLLERIPPSTWAPYPFAMSLPLYDGTIELCASLRTAVKVLLSSPGLELLKSYYQDQGLAGGLKVSADLVTLLFEGVLPATTTVATDIADLNTPKPGPMKERFVSEVSRVSSIDLAWSRTLVEQDISGRTVISRAALDRDISASSKASHSNHHTFEGDEEMDDIQCYEDNDMHLEVDTISHLGSLDGEGTTSDFDRTIDAEFSTLSRDLVFWRPDFLFDLSKVNHCESCSHRGGRNEGEPAVSNSPCSTCWPPSSTNKMKNLGSRLRPCLVPPISICEINARFTMNAFALTALGADASSRLLRKGSRKANSNSQADPACWSDLNAAPVHRLVVMKDEIRKHIASPGGCRIWLVKGREKGYDCHAMEELLGISPVQQITPSDLPSLLETWFRGLNRPSACEGSCNYPFCPNYKVGASLDLFECNSACPSHHGGASCTLLIFLELHQDEILKLPISTLRYLMGSVPAVRNCCCQSTMRIITCNPLPAIFLLHDKRTLALFADQNRMERLVGHRAAEMLAKCIILTVPLSDLIRSAVWRANPGIQAACQEVLDKNDKEKGVTPFQTPNSSSSLSQDQKVPDWMVSCVKNAVDDPSCFVLKRAQSGKGAGMIYGREVSRTIWLKTLFFSESGSYVLQPLVKQATFPCVLSADSVKEQTDLSTKGGCGDKLCQPRICHVVGCLPFMGDTSFGPGIYRASPAGHRPVSVTSGGAILLPSLMMTDAPFAQQAPRWLIKSAKVFFPPLGKEGDEFDLMAKLRSQTDIWKSCGDCALRDFERQQANLENLSSNLREHYAALLFYSGVSVLAYREPEVLAHLFDMKKSKLMDDNDKCRTLVSPPPIASNLQEAKEMLARYGVCIWRALNDKSEGRVKDQRKATVDNSSSINEVLQHAVTQLGGKARSHYTASSGQTDDSQAEGLIWDISPRCCSSARSHDAKAFPMHTDASFKTDPPTHFLLFVLSQDVLGGGLSSILSGGMLLRVLSPAARMLLSRPTFTFQIPEEFRCKEGNCPEQGPSFVSQSILMTPSYRWRFRSDIVSGPNPHVIRHLDELLRNPSLSVQMRLIPGSALLMDNGLFFHARSNVLDSERWLKRMQFYLPNVEDK